MGVALLAPEKEIVTGLVTLAGLTEIGPFMWHWPGGEEKFDRTWIAMALVRDDWIIVRHALGSRFVYGRQRRHSVTWVAGKPMVEGVEADDYADSHTLLSLLRRPNRHLVRDPNEVPSGYERFAIVNHRTALDAKRSPVAKAVAISEDDLSRWTTHALLRAGLGFQEHRSFSPAIRLLEKTVLPGSPAPLRPIVTNSRAVAQRLLAYGEEQRLGPHKTPKFSPIPAANALLIKDPFAFLLAVICDQGIEASRAWTIPYRLRKRMGHLDPKLMVKKPAAVRKAVKGPPALHRYLQIIPRWLVAAARRVLDKYQGDAGRIWSDLAPASELQDRFDAFLGIGQKKAAMAVAILSRDFGLDIPVLQGNDIAYDVHIRRVFLRAGLAERDDAQHMILAARRLNPAQPAALDFPAWLVGRNWCHPGIPACGACILYSVCAKQIERAASVKGA